MIKHRSHYLASVAVRSLRLVAFDPGKAGWKMNADGTAIEMKDGNPVWIDANGGEAVMQSDAITKLNGEAKTLRQQKEAAETQLATFKDIDPVVARKAIETVSKIDAKKLIDSGEVDKLTDQIKGQFTAQLSAETKRADDLQNNLNNMKIDGIFNSSDFVRNEIAVPADMFQATFRQNFKIDNNGNVKAYDRNGNVIMSEQNIGQDADPQEALKLLVEKHPQKDVIRKAAEHTGSGNGGGGGGRGGGRVIKRADFDKLPPHQQAAGAEAMGNGELTIVD